MRLAQIPFGTTDGSAISGGRSFVMTAGHSYQVADGADAHRSHTNTGAKLFIVD